MDPNLEKTIKMFKITEEEMKSYKPGRIWYPDWRIWADDPVSLRDDIVPGSEESTELTPTMAYKANLISKKKYDEIVREFLRPGTKDFSELPQEEQEFVEKYFSELEEEEFKEKGGEEEK